MSLPLNPDSNPFDLAMDAHAATGSMAESLMDVATSVDMAKRILLQHRVKEFTGADVVALTALILERESVLENRFQQD